MKIMIVEDDITIQNELEILLKSAEYEVLILKDFEHSLDYILDNKPDLLLLDIQIPYLNGEMLLKQIRKHTQMSVIMVTSKDNEADEVLSMSYGADDYITKPYNPTLLLLRIQAVLKRSSVKQDSYYHDIYVDLNKGILSTSNKEVILTKNEMIIFNYMFNHLGHIVTRDELMTDLWDNKEYVSDNTLTVNISRLRNKLNELGYKDSIVTRKGQGYLLL
ncbi:MAG: response regulator transcription factor [Eggerthia catenaformis]|uniref:response regulator transcription factor n=1 Tax=Eggerthia catenaformis TaxID=31973 RepID=UPI00047ECB2A|nr:response regulator transcription factor [Eggerthia catenaformis]OUC51140.1 DNA-binding response regulator [Eggerthia catenaformis]